MAGTKQTGVELLQRTTNTYQHNKTSQDIIDVTDFMSRQLQNKILQNNSSVIWKFFSRREGTLGYSLH